MAASLASPGPDRIAREASAAAFALAPGPASALGRWLDRLVAWNARIDLTAARSEDELADLMLADALALASRLPAGARVVDVGTGAGAPGLALGLARPDLDVTLAEPLQKRVAFLRTVLGELGAPNLRVRRDRGEALAAAGARFDVAMARATLPPPAWLALGAELVAPGGSVWVLLAREPAPALAGWSIADDVAYRWPLTGAERRLVRYVAGAP